MTTPTAPADTTPAASVARFADRTVGTCSAELAVAPGRADPGRCRAAVWGRRQYVIASRRAGLP